MSQKRKGVPKSAETRRRMSASWKHRTQPRASDETKRRMSEAHKRHIESCAGCGSAFCQPSYEDTSLEKQLVGVILAEFPTVETQKRFGHYRVDAYLPEYQLAFEADGHYWHRDKPGQSADDARRDQEILARFGVTVVRLDEDDLAIRDEIDA